MTERKKKIGRPKLPKSKAKAVFSLRLEPQDQRRIEAAAKRAGQPVTQWARNALRSASIS